VDPQIEFLFGAYFGLFFNEQEYQFELSKDESEVRVRHVDIRNSATTINEWLMTETNPGDGFTIIEKKPSTISDLLKDVGIKLQSRRKIKKMI
jgi:hypothetical protein